MIDFDWLYAISAVFQPFFRRNNGQESHENYNYQVLKASTYPLHRAIETLAYPIKRENDWRKTINLLPMLKYNDG